MAAKEKFEKEDWIRRIKALLAISESLPDTDPQGIAASVKAMELMAKWGISDAVRAQSRPGSDPLVNVKILFTGTNAEFKRDLYIMVVKAFHGDALLIPGADDVRNRVHIFIYKSDRERVKMLHASLLVQAETALGSAVIPPHESKRSFTVGFWAAFIKTVKERLDAASRTAEAEAVPGAAVALRDRSLAVQDAMHAEYSKIKPGGKRTLKSSAGWEAGTAAGYAADLGQSRIGGDKPSLGPSTK